MADEQGHDSYATGPAVPPEALQGGTMNQNPNFHPSTGDEPEAEHVEFDTVPGGRQKYVLPGRYPMKNKRTKDVDGKVLIVKGLTRVDH